MGYQLSCRVKANTVSAISEPFLTDINGKLSRSQWFLVVTACFAFAFKFGLNYAESNQNQYLLPALKALHPDLYTRDWTVNGHTIFHILFPSIAKFLLILSPEGWGFAIANVITSALVGYLVFLIIRKIVEPSLLIPTFLIVITISGLTITKSAGTVYICSTIFQPSTLGALGFLAGIFFFLKERYLLSGLCLALGGINHANYLMLALPTFGLAHLLLGNKRLFTRLLLQFPFMIAAVIPFLPLMLQIANSPDAALANHIYVDIRLPHHHNPAWFWQSLVTFGLIVSLCLFIGWKYVGNRPAHTHLKAIFYAMLTGIVLGLLLTTVVFSYSVARFMPWRTTPFVLLIAHIIGIYGLLKIFTVTKWKRHAYTLAISIWILGGLGPLVLLYKNSNLLSGYGKNETELYEWARTTDKNALFCVQPLMEDFRIQSQRSVFIDWKPAPSMPSEIVEWYHRMEAVSGVDGFTHLQQTIDGYNGMTTERLQILCEKYGINYVVLRSDWMKQPLDAPTVFENEIYRVVKAGTCGDSLEIR